MKNIKYGLRVSLLGVTFLIQNGCSSVAAYQKAFINDADMKLSDRKFLVFESNFQSYREGVSGGLGGKSGGGCGCN